MDIDISFDGQLIYASLKLVYKGTSKVINKLVVDTGAANTLIALDKVEDIKLSYEDEDFITTFYGVSGPGDSFEKILDYVEFGSKRFSGYKVDFGSFSGGYDINGLIGLDLLKDAGVTIDLQGMRIIEPE